MATDKQTTKKGFSRRKFFQRGAIILGGTVVATYLGRGIFRREGAQMVENLDFPPLLGNSKPNFWFEVLPDNTILLKSPKVEMGQGIFTGFAMLAAEELEVPISQIKVEHSNSADSVVDKMTTGGSNSTSSLYMPIREMAATMREMLKLAAAKKWNTSADKITAQNGVLSFGNNKTTYAEIAQTTKDWDIPKTPTLKPAKEFKYVGTSVKRIDLKPKVFGKPIFGIDQQLPEMLHAVVLRTPYIDGTIKSISINEAQKTNDVIKVINEKDLVAVVAKTRYAAEMGLAKIQVEWNVPKKWQSTDFEELITVGKGTEVNVQKEGSAKDIIEKNQATVFQQEYRTPVAAHAQMEPNGAIVHAEKDKATVLMATQAPTTILQQVGSALGIGEDDVTLKMEFAGGGFGRRMNINNAAETARISKIMGKPVKVFNTREQEFQNGHYRPNSHHVLKAHIAQDGTIEAITHNQATPDEIVEVLAGKTALSAFGADFISAGHGASILYNIKNKSATLWHNRLPIATGIWRSVGMLPNTFAIESFINELAHKTNKDPLQLRIDLLKGNEKINERYLKVLETLREKSNWKTPKTAGIGRGIAIANDRKTIAAAVVEVAIIDNKIQVKKVTNVLDVGVIINPEGIKQQMEGCVMMGISTALYESLSSKDGQLASTFMEYPVATLADVPEIDNTILANDDVPYGVGEPPIAPIAPAIAAAIFDLTGKNFRSLPFKLL